jgi:NADH dehydrogenase
MRLPRVVIIGAGFAGFTLARRLAGKPVEVVLVDRNNYHLFTPLLYQVASSLLNPSDICYPIRTAFRRVRNVKVRRAEVTGVDLDRRVVETAPGVDIPYDRLVLATGSTTNFFGMEPVEASALGLKDLPEAMQLRNHVLSRFEEAVLTVSEEERRSRMTFVVVGGGPTGVEYAGALSELVRLVLRKDFPELDMREVRIVLVELRERLLPVFREELSRYALQELARRRIEVRLTTGLVAVEPDGVRLSDGEKIPAGTLVWAAGVKPAGIAHRPQVPRSESGRIRVDATLRIPGRPDVFVIGDLAGCVQDGEELPMVAPPAMQQARYVARTIRRDLAGKPLAPFRYRDKGIMATIGRKAAVAESGRIALTGFFGWVAWLFLHLFYIIGFRNRFVVLLYWAIEYFRYDRPVRLIARARQTAPTEEAA